MTGCIFCGRGLAQGVNLFRINKKGEPGVWACDDHIKNTDAKVDSDVQVIVDAVNPRRRR